MGFIGNLLHTHTWERTCGSVLLSVLLGQFYSSVVSVTKIELFLIYSTVSQRIINVAVIY